MGYVFKVENNQILTSPIFDTFEDFPQHQKLAKIQLTNGLYKYLLLDEVISPYDSGVRYLQKDKLYQVNMSYAYNIFDVKFANNIYYLNLRNISYTNFALRNIFDSRIRRDNDLLFFTSPRKELGITKMLVIGLNTEVSCMDTYEDGEKNRYHFTTYRNGWCNYKNVNIDRYKGKAMLIKFDPNRLYRIRFQDSLNFLNYSEKDKGIKNFIFFGKEIEELPEVSSNYAHVFHTNNFFTTNPDTLELENYKSVRCRNELINFKEQLGRYVAHQYIYNFYDLKDLQLF